MIGNYASLLTQTPISTIAKYGGSVQSNLARKFINSVRDQLSIEIIACYLQTEEKNIFVDGAPTDRFIDEEILFLWTNSDNYRLISENPLIKRTLWRIFHEACFAMDILPEYHRLLTPEERVYYGFNNRSITANDLTTIKQPQKPVEKKYSIIIDNLDILALQHLVSNSKEMIQRLFEKKYSILVKVVVDYPPELNFRPTHIFVFDSVEYYGNTFFSTDITKVKSIVSDQLCSKDHWHVLERYYQPMCAIWDQIDKTKRFDLLRN